MCYAAPGPRCSNHTKKDLDEALASGNQDAIDKARKAWHTSPAGVEELRENGKGLEADVAEMVRAEQLARFHKCFDADLYSPKQVRELGPDLIAARVKAMTDIDKSSYARSPQACGPVLAGLADDKDFSVRAGVANNINSHPATLSTLLGDPNPLVRTTTASNPALRQSDFARAAADKEELVREAVAANLSAPREVLESLLENNQDNPIIARQMLRNENLDEDLQERATDIIRNHGLADVWNFQHA